MVFQGLEMVNSQRELVEILSKSDFFFSGCMKPSMIIWGKWETSLVGGFYFERHSTNYGVEAIFCPIIQNK